MELLVVRIDFVFGLPQNVVIEICILRSRLVWYRDVVNLVYRPYTIQNGNNLPAIPVHILFVYHQQS